MAVGQGRYFVEAHTDKGTYFEDSNTFRDVGQSQIQGVIKFIVWPPSLAGPVPRLKPQAESDLGMLAQLKRDADDSKGQSQS